jgi:ribonuclease VapC
MVVDTSALCAILFAEPERDVFLQAIMRSGERCLSAATAIEVSIVVMRRSGSDIEARARAFMERAHLKIMPFDEAQAEIARVGFQLYGKGRHPAGLNMGDCFSYALAKRLDEPLLFKGKDFSLTDVRSAL